MQNAAECFLRRLGLRSLRLLAFLLLPGTAIAQSESGSILAIKNLDDTPITHVYLSQSFDAMGALFKDTDQLKSSLGKNQSVELDIRGITSFLPPARCFLDIRAVFGDGSWTTRTNQNICALPQQNFVAPGSGTPNPTLTFFTNRAESAPAMIYVRPSAQSTWWEYKGDKYGKDRSFGLNVLPEDGCRFDFRVQFSVEREVEVDNANICRLADFDVYEPPPRSNAPSAYTSFLNSLKGLNPPINSNPPPRQDDLALTLRNSWRLPLRAMYVRAPDPDKELTIANFSINLLKGMDPLLPRTQAQVKLPSAGCKWDVIEVFDKMNETMAFGGRGFNACWDANAHSLEAAGPPDNRLLSYGSGFLISRQGHIVTNAHVALACGRITARAGYNQDEIELRVIAQNQLQDLALLQMPVSQTPAFALRDPARSPPQQGEPIILMGFPEPIKLGHQFIPTPGSLGGLKGANGSDNYYMVEASLRPGDSGGPITDAYGLVIGVNEGYLPGDSDTLHFGVQVSALLDWLRSLDVPVTLKQPEGALPANQDVVSRSRAMVQQLLCYSS